MRARANEIVVTFSCLVTDPFPHHCSKKHRQPFFPTILKNTNASFWCSKCARIMFSHLAWSQLSFYKSRTPSVATQKTIGRYFWKKWSLSFRIKVKCWANRLFCSVYRSFTSTPWDRESVRCWFRQLMGNWLVVGKSWGGSVNVEPAVTNMLQIYKCRSWATPLCILETCKFKATIFYDLAFFGLSNICTHAPLFSQNCNNCLQSFTCGHVFFKTGGICSRSWHAWIPAENASKGGATVSNEKN